MALVGSPSVPPPWSPLPTRQVLGYGRETVAAGLCRSFYTAPTCFRWTTAIRTANGPRRRLPAIRLSQRVPETRPRRRPAIIATLHSIAVRPAEADPRSISGAETVGPVEAYIQLPKTDSPRPPIPPSLLSEIESRTTFAVAPVLAQGFVDDAFESLSCRMDKVAAADAQLVPE